MATSTAEGVRIIKALRETPSIYNEATSLIRKALQNPNARSNQSVGTGRIDHLYDLTELANIRDFNPHHSACIQAKVEAHVGTGHRRPGIEEALNPVCTHSLLDLEISSAEDYWMLGDCYWEVSRNDEDDPNKITGLYHLPASRVHVEIEEEDNREEFHYSIEPSHAGEDDLLMAPFGCLAEFKARFEASVAPGERNANDAATRTSSPRVAAGKIVNSEVLHFRRPGSKSIWYGGVDYLAGIPSIELVQCMTQFEFDFFFNRGVPEFIMFMIGRNINDATWEQVTEMIKAQQGLGNAHKTAAVQIPGAPEEISVQIEKLALDQDDSGKRFADSSIQLAMNIVSVHGVPPLLASIQIPAKAGGMNEGPNSLLLFQKMRIGQAQRLWSQTLATTIGRGDQSLAHPTGDQPAPAAAEFLAEGEQSMDDQGMPQHVTPGNGYRTVLDGMTLGAMETLASMREPLTGSGRNPADGNLSGTDDRSPTDPRRTR